MKSNIRVALVGSTGYIGQKVLKVLQSMLEVKAFRYNDLQDLQENPFYFNVIVNCAGLVGYPNVGSVQGKIDELRKGNVDLPKKLLEIAKFGNCHLIHLSSGCLYSGYKEIDDPMSTKIYEKEGWLESDDPNFNGSDYVISKRNGELALSDYEKVTILRPRMPFNSDPTDRNLLLKLAKYSKGTIVDSINTITPVDLILEAIATICLHAGQRHTFGTHNLCSLKPISNSQIIEMLQEELNLDFGLDYVHPDAFNESQETKRSFTSICSKKAVANGLCNVRHILDPANYILTYIHDLKKNPAKLHVWKESINNV